MEMMPGQEPYTAEEEAQVHSLVDEAAKLDPGEAGELQVTHVHVTAHITAEEAAALDPAPVIEDRPIHPVPKPGGKKVRAGRAKPSQDGGGETVATAVATKPKAKAAKAKEKEKTPKGPVDRITFPYAKGGKMVTLTRAQVDALAGKEAKALRFGFGSEYVQAVKIGGNAFHVKDAVRQALNKDLDDLRQDVSVRALKALGFSVVNIPAPKPAAKPKKKSAAKK